MLSTAMGERAKTQSRESQSTQPSFSERLSSPRLRKVVERFVRRRVPEPEVEDLVQTVFLHALASESAPDEDEALRKWLVGITRHKVADFHRKGGRVRHVELPDQLSDDAVAPQSAHEWADWAEKQTQGDPDAQRTLNWMARESTGEKLAHIAEQEKVPATQVRQRVSRMRRFMKRQWAAELAAVAAIVILALVAWRLLREPEPVANPQPDVVPVPEKLPGPEVPPNIQRARELRAEAEVACEGAKWQSCLDKLNQAAGLDPDGDQSEATRALRQQAQDALTPNEPKEPSPAPTTSASVPTRTVPSPKTEPIQKPGPKKAPPSTVPGPKSVPTTKPQGPTGKLKSPTSSGFDFPQDSGGNKSKK